MKKHILPNPLIFAKQWAWRKFRKAVKKAVTQNVMEALCLRPEEMYPAAKPNLARTKDSKTKDSIDGKKGDTRTLADMCGDKYPGNMKNLESLIKQAKKRTKTKRSKKQLQEKEK